MTLSFVTPFPTFPTPHGVVLPLFALLMKSDRAPSLSSREPSTFPPSLVHRITGRADTPPDRRASPDPHFHADSPYRRAGTWRVQYLQIPDPVCELSKRA